MNSTLKYFLVLFPTAATVSCGSLSPSGGKGHNGVTSSSDVAAAESGAPTDTGSASQCSTPPATSNWEAASAVLQPHCFSCHATQVPVFSNQAEAESIASQISASANAGRMPPGSPLAKVDNNLLKAWASSMSTALALAGTTPTYEVDIKPMVDAKCAWCHSASAAPGTRHSPYLTTYTAVKSKYGDVMGEMQKNAMPPRNVVPKLTTGDIPLLLAWKAAGFPQGTPPAPIETSKGVFYQTDIQTLLASNCVTCHAPGATAPDLSSYEGAAAAGKSALAAVRRSSMPKSAPLSANGQDAMQAWVDTGMPFAADGSAPPPVPEAPLSAATGATGPAAKCP